MASCSWVLTFPVPTRDQSILLFRWMLTSYANTTQFQPLFQQISVCMWKVHLSQCLSGVLATTAFFFLYSSSNHTGLSVVEGLFHLTYPLGSLDHFWYKISSGLVGCYVMFCYLLSLFLCAKSMLPPLLFQTQILWKFALSFWKLCSIQFYCFKVYVVFSINFVQGKFNGVCSGHF
jgi:hypothetical protein